MGLVNELRKPSEMGAYNAGTVLDVMVAGLEEELELRQSGVISGPPAYMEPSVDNISPPTRPEPVIRDQIETVACITH